MNTDYACRCPAGGRFCSTHEIAFWKIHDALLYCCQVHPVSGENPQEIMRASRGGDDAHDIGKDAVDPRMFNFCCIREHPWQVETKMGQVCIERPETVSVVQLLHGSGGVILVSSMLRQCLFVVPKMNKWTLHSIASATFGSGAFEALGGSILETEMVPVTTTNTEPVRLPLALHP